MLGRTAATLRQRLGLTQRQVADSLGITVVHLSNIENNKAAPSQSLIDQYRRLWGIDLYVLAWCTNGNVERLPRPLRNAANKLAEAMERQLPDDIRPSTTRADG